MNASFFIAKHYFFSKKKKNFINVIAIISMLLVAVGTMALVIALSVLNGMEDLVKSYYGSLDPELKVIPAEGKSFNVDENFLSNINKIEGVAFVTEVIEDYAYAKYKESTMIVRMKGVSDNFIQQKGLKKILEDQGITPSQIKLHDDSINFTLISYGVENRLGIFPESDFVSAILMFYPKNINAGSTGPLYNQKPILPVHVLTVENHEGNDFIYVPLNFAATIMDYGNKRTALEISVQKSYSISDVKNKIKKMLGSGYQVLDSNEQHASLMRAIKIEKLFVYIVFSFILILASVNIFFSLTMLVIEKKKDITILAALGTSSRKIKQIFLQIGLIIALSGAIFGLLGGYAICFLQQKFQFVSLGATSALQEGYPIKIIFTDFLFTGITIVVITVLAALRPSIIASRTFLLEKL